MNKTSSRGKCCHSLVCVKQDLKPGWVDHQFPSHHPLRLERGPAAHTVYEIRDIQSMRSGRRVRYLHPQAWKNHQKKNKQTKKKTDALLLCPGFLFTDLNLPISCWEINYSNSYSNIPQMNQKWSTLLHHKIKTTWKDCVQELKKALGLSATSKHHQPHCTTMPPRISVVKKKKTHWNVKGENQNW